MRCLEIVYRSVTVLTNLNIFKRTFFVEIKSRWYSPVKQLMSCLRAIEKISAVQANKQTKCALLAFF